MRREGAKCIESLFPGRCGTGNQHCDDKGRSVGLKMITPQSGSTEASRLEKAFKIAKSSHQIPPSNRLSCRCPKDSAEPLYLMPFPNLDGMRKKAEKKKKQRKLFWVDHRHRTVNSKRAHHVLGSRDFEQGAGDWILEKRMATRILV